MNKKKQAKYMRQYYADNKETMRETARKSHAANKEKRCAKMRQYYVANKDKQHKYMKQYRADNKESISKYNQAYRAANKEKLAAMEKQWHITNRSKCVQRQRLYRARKTEAQPSWLTKKQIKQMNALYAKARRLTKQTSVVHTVDHIIPLLNPTVCGLHVPWNLQILTKSKNSSKNNRY